MKCPGCGVDYINENLDICPAYRTVMKSSNLRRVAVFNSTQTDIEFEADFHCWSQCSDSDGGYPVAVVEKDDGKVESVYVWRIKFI